jgi:hypothetical protein
VRLLTTVLVDEAGAVIRVFPSSSVRSIAAASAVCLRAAIAAVAMAAACVVTCCEEVRQRRIWREKRAVRSKAKQSRARKTQVPVPLSLSLSVPSLPVPPRVCSLRLVCSALAPALPCSAPVRLWAAGRGALRRGKTGKTRHKRRHARTQLTRSPLFRAFPVSRLALVVRCTEREKEGEREQSE